MDAVRLLTEDHLSLGALFKRFQAAQSPRLREDLARRLLHQARLHLALEQKYVYPIAQERAGSHLGVHAQARRFLDELGQLEVEDPGFAPRLTAFAEALLAHSREEEQLLFPVLRKALGRAELEALGRVIQNAREERPVDSVTEGLAARAFNHLLRAWKVQTGHAFERACTAVLGRPPAASSRAIQP